MAWRGRERVALALEGASAGMEASYGLRLSIILPLRLAACRITMLFWRQVLVLSYTG